MKLAESGANLLSSSAVPPKSAKIANERLSVLPRQTSLSSADHGGVQSVSLRESTRICRKFRDNGQSTTERGHDEPALIRSSRFESGLPSFSIFLRILSPIGNTRGPDYTESAIRSLYPRGEEFSLFIESESGRTGLAATVSKEAQSFLRCELQDAYPGVRIEPASGSQMPNTNTWYNELYLHPDFLAIKTYEQFQDAADNRSLSDPLIGLLAAAQTGASARFRARIELRARPATPARIHSAKGTAQRLRQGFKSIRWQMLFVRFSASNNCIARWLAAILYVLGHGSLFPIESKKANELLFECRLICHVRGPSDAVTVAKAKLAEMASAFGRFSDGQTSFQASKIKSGSPRSRRRGFLLTPTEIATIWHLPTVASDSTARVSRPDFRELEPPLLLQTRNRQSSDVLLGRTRFRQENHQIHMPLDDLRRHMLVLGKTGCGKSTFQLNVARQQIEAGRGMVLIDPHGQLAEQLLDTVPKNRTNDVIYFNAADHQSPVGFNPLRGPNDTRPNLLADAVLTSFKNVFGFDRGAAPRLLYILHHCLLTLIGTEWDSLQNIQRLLVDAGFRSRIIGSIRNQSVREFWLKEFGRWSERERTENIASLQNKLGAFSADEQLQAILNAEKGIILRDVMDQSKILICNLSQGTLGHDASKLLGSLILSNLQIAAMSRANIPESERVDSIVMLDEFHVYLDEGNTNMADALSQSRKYGTSYVLASQFLDQLDSSTLSSVLGNCGSLLCMTVGPKDANTLVELLGHGLAIEDLMRIPMYHGYMRMLLDGVPYTLSMTTQPPPRSQPNRAGIIRRVSRERYGLAA